MCQTAFALVPACDEHGVPSRLSGRLVGKPYLGITCGLPVIGSETLWLDALAGNASRLLSHLLHSCTRRA